MGLDISVFTRLRAVEPHDWDDDACWRAQHFRPYNHVDFAGHEAPLLRICYVSDVSDWGFRAGSYSGYNVWRNQLAQMAQGRPDEAVWADPTGPFAELIHFSDCEGTIGPVVSLKLLRDFDAFAEKAARHEDDWFAAKYLEWHAAFRAAADGGAVQFH